MNIFYLDDDPYEASRQLCKVHVNKMIIETAQMLSASHHVLSQSDLPSGLMKSTHVNHPSNRWLRESADHYAWTYEYFLHLLSQYNQWSNKDHKCTERTMALSKMPIDIPDAGFRRAPAAVDDDLKHLAVKYNVFTAYQAHLLRKYNNLWQCRARPIKIEFHYEEPIWFDRNVLV